MGVGAGEGQTGGPPTPANLYPNYADKLFNSKKGKTRQKF